MKDLNKILLVGRLGNEPTRTETKKGHVVVNFSLATSRRIVEQDGVELEEPKQETQWHKVVVWGKQAETCKQFLAKGETVFVDGMLRSRKYTSKEGEPRTAFEVHADQVLFLGGRKRRQDGTGLAAQPAAASAMADMAIPA